jgi:hypothetical protein
MTSTSLSFCYDAHADLLRLSLDAPLPKLTDVTAHGLNWIDRSGYAKPAGLTITDFRADWQHDLPTLARTVAAGFQIHLREAHEVLKWHLWDMTEAD